MSILRVDHANDGGSGGASLTLNASAPSGTEFVVLIGTFQQASSSTSTVTWSATVDGNDAPEAVSGWGDNADRDIPSYVVFTKRTSDTSAINYTVTASSSMTALSITVVYLDEIPGSTDTDAIEDTGSSGALFSNSSDSFNLDATGDDTIAIGGWCIQGGAAAGTPGSGYDELVDTNTGATGNFEHSVFVQSQTFDSSGTKTFDASWPLPDGGSGAAVLLSVGAGETAVDIDAEHTAHLPTQDASVEPVVDTDAEHSAHLATQDASIDALADIAADHTTYLATQGATIDALIDVAAEHTAYLPTQVSSVGLLIDIAADHSAYLATMDAAIEVVAGEIDIDADHAAHLPTQDASVDAIVDADGDHTTYLPTQSAAVSVEVDAAAEHTAYLPTQSAAVSVEIDIAGEHSAYLATQGAAVGVIVDIAADHSAHLATQDASIDVVSDEVDIDADHSAYLATMDAAVGVIIDIVSDHNAHLPTQNAAIEVEADIEIAAEHTGYLPRMDAGVGVLIDIGAEHAALLATMAASISIGDPAVQPAIQRTGSMASADLAGAIAAANGTGSVSE